ncbi:hypothetical protein [Psychromonas antarctica]|uniref:hypothetical protein n=1 Tax=Psychromonas antarctica TaxID=67573 RepID=UPI001EE8E3F9|nr:hypothetical protein [Psychromonas antarctica]MCG6200572.1 hypothetical protein [Psychromonas antarctica]
MDISGTSNLSNQSTALYRNEPNSSTLESIAVQNQQQSQSVDKVTTEQPVQKTIKLNQDIVNERVSEHQSLSSGNMMAADEAVGSLIDVRV